MNLPSDEKRRRLRSVAAISRRNRLQARPQPHLNVPAHSCRINNRRESHFLSGRDWGNNPKCRSGSLRSSKTGTRDRPRRQTLNIFLAEPVRATRLWPLHNQAWVRPCNWRPSSRHACLPQAAASISMSVTLRNRNHPYGHHRNRCPGFTRHTN